MPVIQHNPSGVFPPYRGYAHATEVHNSRLLVISGLNGFLEDGQTMPATFEEQGEVIWKHLGTILKSAGMAYGDLISLRTYLADPADDEANVRLRMKYLAGHKVAFRYSVPTANPDYLRVKMAADSGPLGTRDYQLVIEATPLDAKRSFIHLSYSYSYGIAARVAMQGYLSTLGRDKVGFSITGQGDSGKPVYVGGLRGDWVSAAALFGSICRSTFS